MGSIFADIHSKTSMPRLSFLYMPCVLLMVVSCSKSSSTNKNARSSPGDISLSFAIDPSQPGQNIPGDFSGLSFETKALTDPSYFNAANSSFINLVRGLGTGVLRVGGNSVDRMYWTNGPRDMHTASNGLTTSDVDRFFGFAAATGWKVMYALNLGSSGPREAAYEARYVYGGYGRQLLCFEIGNEPDFYYANGLRAPGYSYESFRQEFEHMADTLKEVVPGVVFSGPAAATHTDIWVLPFPRDEHARIMLLTEHYYKMGPPANPAVTIDKLLDGNSGIISEAGTMRDAAGAYQLPFRIAECNSVFDGGKAGVSNTLASALWGLDFMFALAERGAAGVNFHGGGSSDYGPIALSDGQFSARPLYYGLLFFSHASGGSLLNVTKVSGDSMNVSAHAVRQDDGKILVTLINKDLSKEAFVAMSTGHKWLRGSSLLRLTGPSPADSTGIRLGGAPVNADGSWSPLMQEEAAIAGNTCTVKIPACSAVLLTLQ